MARTGAPYRTESGDLVDKEGNPIRARRGKGLERIDALSTSLTAEQVLKAVSAQVVGLLYLNKEQQASLYKLAKAMSSFSSAFRSARETYSDSDGLGDACDPDPLDSDFDDDTLNDDVDPSPASVDGDGDSVGDAADNCPLVANAIVWFVAALWSIGDVAPAAHNLGPEDDSF